MAWVLTKDGVKKRKLKCKICGKILKGAEGIEDAEYHIFEWHPDLDYAFKKTLEAEEDLRKYIQTGDSAHLIYCINNLGTAIREVIEILEDLDERFEELENEVEEIKEEVDSDEHGK